MQLQSCMQCENIQKEDIIHFEEGIPGFFEYKDYVLVQDEDGSPVMCLQSATSKTPSFVVVDPFAFIHGYAPIISKSDLEYFGVDSANDLRFLAITILSKDILDSVVNLKSPIAINPRTREAKQVFVENSEYSLRHHLFQNNG